jgi:hypothetical protein
LDDFEGQNVLSRKKVRSFVGRANHAAGLLMTLRPFLQSIWASLATDNEGPANTVWEKQIHHSLTWLRSFFAGKFPGIERNFTLQEYLQSGPQHEIGTGASPYGLRAWLAVSGKIVKYFACPVTQEDREILGLEAESCKGQQVLEALAILVALRLWTGPKDCKSIRLCVRGDNIGSLTLIIKMRPASAQQAIIAREIALLTVHQAFPPRVVHTPGVAHVIADGLSRIHDRKKDTTNIFLHPALTNAVRSDCPTRTRDYYKTLCDAAPLRRQDKLGADP